MVILFICRDSKKSKKSGKAPLEMAVTINHQRKSIRLPYQVVPSLFNSKKQKVTNDKTANDYIDAIRRKAFCIETEMMQRRMNISADSFVEIFKNGWKDSRITLLSIINDYVCKSENRYKNGLLTRAVYIRHQNIRKRLTEYLNSLSIKDIELTEVTPSLIEGFYIYLCGSMKKNTAIQRMKSIKTVLQTAVADGYITHNPYRLKLTEEDVICTPLTLDEIRRIREKDFGIDRLNKVRDLFIFQCYSGLAYADIASLTTEHFVTEGTQEWIIKPRVKTKVVSLIPLLPVAKEIWEYYDHQLPLISNARYNSYLKEIGAVCGIQASLHTHLARHTFASLLINQGVELKCISKVLGHSTTRVTEKTYATLLNQTIAARVIMVQDKII